MSLTPWLRIFEDPTGRMSLEQVRQLLPGHWQPATPQRLSPGFTRSALWLEFEVHNASAAPCHVAVAMGTGRVRDLRLYREYDDNLETLVGGASHPFQAWADQVRLPVFPLMLASDERSRVLIRASTELALSVHPSLLSNEALLKTRMGESLLDGVVFGIVGVLVFFSLTLGRLRRIPLLVSLSMTVLCYCLHIALVNGYGFAYLWPGRSDWDLQAVVLSLLLARLLALGYLRTLLQVRLLPAVLGRFLRVCQAALVVMGLAFVLWPEQSVLLPGSLLDQVWIGITILGLFAVLVQGWRQGWRFGWFTHLLLALVLLQALLGYATLLGLGPLLHGWLSLSSVPGVLLLVYTLWSQVALGRAREKQAITDVEQLKQAEQERLEHSVQVRTDQLRESLRSQSLLLARISHDLRSPLQAIINAAQLLQEAKLPPDSGARSIARSAHQQLELIDELLEYSHSEIRQLELLVAPGYLFGFLEETQEQARFLAERNDNQLYCDFAEDLPPLVAADFRRLRQVLVNLLANAAKFTHGGEIRLHVSREADAPSGQVVLCFAVSDNGMGVAAAELEMLQEPFSRGENARLLEGSGLGLYIVRQMLDRMGTQLRIEPLATGGSRFSFLIALDLAHEHELDQFFIESHQPHQEGNGRRVLIVDDVAITREMLHELLAGYDYDSLTCSSGEEALKLLKERPLDLLIVDQLMPGMDGWSLLLQVRARYPHLPVLLYSSAPARRPVHIPADLEFDARLQKPADSADLLAVLETLQKRRSGGEGELR